MIVDGSTGMRWPNQHEAAKAIRRGILAALDYDELVDEQGREYEVVVRVEVAEWKVAR